MTKPITTVSAMMLFEEGRLQLSDPVAKYIAPFGGVKVGVEKPAGDGEADPGACRRQAADETAGPDAPHLRADLRLLRRHAGEEAVCRERQLTGDSANAEFVERLAKLPLAFQPGTTWDYSYSTDVLGRVVEVVAGKPLLQVMKQRLFDPLGMKDSSFYVTDKAQQPRSSSRSRTTAYRRRRRRQRPARGEEVGVGRRRADVDGDGLCALRPDAAERRHARRQALPQPEDPRLHGIRPRGPA